MRPLSSHPYPGSIEINRLTTADFVGSTGVHDDSAAVARADLELLTGIETQFSPPHLHEDLRIQKVPFNPHKHFLPLMWLNMIMTTRRLQNS